MYIFMCIYIYMRVPRVPFVCRTFTCISRASFSSGDPAGLCDVGESGEGGEGDASGEGVELSVSIL